MISRATILIIALICFPSVASAQAIKAGDLLGHSDSWYTSNAGKQIITNVISWQTPDGGWAKGYKQDHVHQSDEPYGEWEGVGTIDNNYTYTEIRFLAHAYNLAQRQDALDSCVKGIDYLIKAQYPNGGWPQRYPLPKNYGREITYNDNAMTNVLRLLEDIHTKKPEFAFVEDGRRQKCEDAWNRGIDCVIKSQVKSGGKLTAWAQQYDPDTLLPATGRAYELPSISGSESAGIMELLMSLDKPSPEAVRGVHAAAAWFEASKITGKRIDHVKVPDTTRPVMKIVDDPTAAPMWARFYELETNRPFFCNRDGIKRFSLDEVDPERRAGYQWYGHWGNKALEDYAKWAKDHPAQS
jgi:PelA/Pel-15E family pectate lyase